MKKRINRLNEKKPSRHEKMSEKKFYSNMIQLGLGTEACLEKKLITPSLVLIYSAIDITGWIASGKSKTYVRSDFTTWVNRYMLPHNILNCTADELYSARCGIVHTLTADSKLVEKGQARRIVYA